MALYHVGQLKRSDKSVTRLWLSNSHDLEALCDEVVRLAEAMHSAPKLLLQVPSTSIHALRHYQTAL